MYIALGIVFLVVSIAVAALIITMLVHTFIKENQIISKKSLAYLAPSLALVFGMYITAAVYGKEQLTFFYVFWLLGESIDFLFFSPNLSLIGPLCSAYSLFLADFIITAFISTVTVVLSVISFFGPRLRNFFAKLVLFKKDSDIVIGNSADAVRYIKNNKNCIMWGTDLSKQDYAQLLKAGICVFRSPFTASAIVPKLKKGEHNFIVFRDGGYSYTNVVEVFTEIKKSGCSAYLHLDANPEERKIIRDKFIEKADADVSPYITNFCKHELIARKFVFDYPLTKFIPRGFYNPNLTLKKNKQVNVVFAGFGKVNYQLFKMCATQFQFAEERAGKLYSKPVHYYVYDSDGSQMNNEFFSKILYEFDDVFKDADFSKPEKICDVTVASSGDINSIEARKSFKSLVDENSFTYFIISLENDLEDASCARTIERLLAEKGNYRIFVRAKNSNNERLNRENDSVIYFGDEKSIYTHASIVNDDLANLAQRINILYNEIANPPQWLAELKEDVGGKECAVPEASLKDKRCLSLMREEWGKLQLIEQDSNLYHALNIPFKLNLLGLDMVKNAEKKKAISEKQFDILYDNPAREQKYNDYTFYFGLRTSNVLAFIEHLRWNALYILNDYTQMKKCDIQPVPSDAVPKNAVHKDTAGKKHACLTDYYGLDELVKFKYALLYPEEDVSKISLKDNARLNELAKIYAYDFMDLDKLYGELRSLGFTMVEK